MTEFFCLIIFGTKFAGKDVHLTKKRNEKDTTTPYTNYYLKF